jgi:hypothetical protein
MRAVELMVAGVAGALVYELGRRLWRRLETNWWRR